MTSIPELFGSEVFNETIMRQKLPANIFDELKKTIDDGKPLNPDIAQSVANAMLEWALSKSVTHYAHWFQPMTGLSAEKHDAFLTPKPEGRIIMEFSGKELIKGESDASSFPSGGLRATFEARGYTAWDPTAYAFIKDNTLYIPTAFYSYSGECLDKKTPLLRSMDAVNRQALRVLKFFKHPATRVITTMGAEQEYFLIDKNLYDKRDDLRFSGRTLFGAKPPKGQERVAHYYRNLKERVSLFMKELDIELWKLGIYAKTEHNEAAPAQHELAPVYCITNIAADHNQLTMEMMKKVALRHNLYCLLNEKPFAHVNGSGKHNNWSLNTNTGESLFKPGKNPAANKQFLLMVAAVLRAVDEYAGILRMTVATAGNDHRLGAAEAPPAIVSVFLGDELTTIYKNFINGKNDEQTARVALNTGVESFPLLYVDTNDRNRTSPFAFTGNKFEFRMPGSSQSISGINFVLNTMMADSLMYIADRLEKSENPDLEIDEIIKDIINKHNRIIFNGNNYAAEWVIEAEKRGLLNLKSAVDALPEFISEKSIKLFERHNILSETEIMARYEIMLEDYSESIHIEANTMIDMTEKEIIPAVLDYEKSVFEGIMIKKQAGIGVNFDFAEKYAKELNNLSERLMERTIQLKDSLNKTLEIKDEIMRAKDYKNSVIPAMNLLRETADILETKVSKKYWPFPTYSELLFKI